MQVKRGIRIAWHSWMPIAGFVLVVAGASGFACAQTGADWYAECRSDRVADDARIAACTRAIASGALNAAQLARAYMHRAGMWLSKRDFVRAYADYSESIRAQPEDPDFYFGRSLVSRVSRDSDREISDINAAIRIDPRRAEFHEAKGYWHFRRREYPAAMQAYDQALAIAPTMVDSLLRRGIARYELDNTDGALADFDGVVRIKPDEELAYFYRGMIWFLRKDQAARAVPEFDRAIRLNPRDAENYYRRGSAYGNLKEHERAVADYSEAISRDPAYMFAWMLRGVSHLQLKRFEQAMADLERAIALDSRQAVAYRHRAWLWSNHRKDIDRALEDYARAIELAPRWVEVYLERANLYLRHEMPSHAVADFAKAAELQPKNETALFGLGRARVLTNDLDGSVAALDRALALAPRNGEFLGLRGYVQFLRKRYAEALADSLAAVDVNPQRVASMNRAAWLLATAPFALRDGRRAVEFALQACEQSAWKDPDYIDTLAAAHAEARNFREAIRFQEQAIEMIAKAGGSLAGPRERLELYRRGEPYRLP